MPTLEVEEYLNYSPHFRQQLMEYFHYHLTETERHEIEERALKKIQRDNRKLKKQNESTPPIIANFSLQEMSLIYLLVTLRWSKYFLDFSPGEMPLAKLYAVGSDGSRLYFIKNLALEETQRVFLTFLITAEEATSAPQGASLSPHFDFRKYSDRLRVVKWVDLNFDKDHIMMEIERWQLLISKGLPHPHIMTHYEFWGSQVLVMDYLSPIDPREWLMIGQQLLALLRIIHQVGVHNDIKPDNIMKDPRSGQYFLIDMAGLATERKFYGFKRLIWSPRWTSQVYEPGMITTAKNDFIELGYTLNYLYFKAESQKELDSEFIRDFHINRGIFMSYIEMVRELDEKLIDDQIYSRLSLALKPSDH